MGLSASQGRLLSITSRLSDVEFSVQQKNQSKIKLAMSTDELTRQYSDALNQTKYVGITGYDSSNSPVYSDLTYDMLTGINSPLAGDYCLTDSANRVLVTQEMATAFESGKGLGGFLAALDKSNSSANVTYTYPAEYPTKSEYDAQQKKLTDAVTAAQNTVNTVPKTIVRTDAEAAAAKSAAYTNWQNAILDYNKAATAASTSTGRTSTTTTSTSLGRRPATTDTSTGRSSSTGTTTTTTSTSSTGRSSRYSSTTTGTTTTGTSGTSSGTTNTTLASLKAKADELEKLYNELPTKGGEVTNPAYTAANKALDNAKLALAAFPTATANSTASPETTYYTNIYNRMAQGYTTKSDEDNTINNAKWINNQIKNGGLFLEKFNTDGTASDKDWDTTGEIIEKRDDTDLDIKKAKYDAELQAIQTKDKKIDMEIKQLDTEHNALQTEVESVQKVIQKNIESSFKTFG